MPFSLALIILLGLGADYLFKRFRLPGLVGMLMAGVLAGPYVWDLMSPEMMAVSGDFRKIALVVILLRAAPSISSRSCGTGSVSPGWESGSAARRATPSGR